MVVIIIAILFADYHYCSHVIVCEFFTAILRGWRRYRRPTPTGKPLSVVGWLEPSGSGRLQVAAEIRLPDGAVTASCQALLVPAPEEYAEIFAPEGNQESWEVYPE